MHRWWMDFGGSFGAIFRRIRRFILVVRIKDAPEKGPNDTQKAPPIYALHTPSPHFSPTSCCGPRIAAICRAFRNSCSST